MYTDDTEMSRCIVQSLIEERKFNATDIAKRFVFVYYSSTPHVRRVRNYGLHVVDVFASLRHTECSNPFKPAKSQFHGQGSFGNGGAMRASPIALFCHGDREKTIKLAKGQALITHAHRDGYNGAVLQCLAVHLALLHDVETNPIDPIKFVNQLSTWMRDVEHQSVPLRTGKTRIDEPYVTKLSSIGQLLADPSGEKRAVSLLGNDISALQSASMAIYAFLRSINRITGIRTDNPIQRTIHFAITMGGDTDTIACMAGAIAGAYFGYDMIPSTLGRNLEGYKEILKEADQLLEVAHGNTQ